MEFRIKRVFSKRDPCLHEARASDRGLLCFLLWIAGTICAFAQTISPSSPVVGGKRWAIVVGASSYEHYGKLQYSVADAKSFADKLKSTLGFDSDTVRLLTDDAEPRLTPTAGHILGELAALLNDKRLDKGDLFVFYFSGHGSGLPSGDYLLPADARPETATQLGVPIRKVVEQFVQAGLNNVLIICDACRSGATNPFGRELNQLAAKSNIAVMQGCEPGQQSREDDKLGRGLFTHFLLKNLEDPTIRHPESGALWARALAEKTSADVFAHGRKSFGKFAQKPTSWTDAKRDILLGAFPSAGATDTALQSFFAQAKLLEPSRYAAALNDYGIRLFDAGMLKESVEAFRVLDSLGMLAPASRYVFTVALEVLDRTEESDQAISRFGTTDADAYYRDLSIASSLSRTFSVEQRLASAERAWALDRTWPTGQIRWTVLKYFGDADKREPFLKEFAAVEDLTPRQRSFLLGESAYVQNRFDEAVSAYKKSISLPGPEPDDEFLRHSTHLALVGKSDGKELEAFLKECAVSGEKKYVWWMLLALHYKSNGRPDEMMAAIRASLKHPIDPEYLWVAVKTAGSRCAEFADEVAVHAKSMPLAWKGQLAASIAEGFAKDGVPGAIKAFTSQEELFEKNSEYNFEGFRFLLQAIDDGIAAGKLDGDRIQFFLQVAAAHLTQFVGQLEQDPEFWLMYVRVMLQGERNVLLEHLLDRKFDPIARPEAIRIDMRAIALMAYLNAGSPEKAEGVLKPGKLPETDDADSRLTLAAYFAADKNAAKASQHLPKRADVSASLHSLHDAVQGLIFALEEKRDEALKIAEKYEETLDLQTNPVIALIFAKLERWDKAEPLFNVSRLVRTWGYGYLHFAVLREYFQHARKTGRHDLADVLAYECTVIQPESRMFHGVHFGEKPEFSTYGGAYEFNVTGTGDWGDTYVGKLTLSVLGSGRVTGVFEPAEGSPIALGGQIDAYGVWTGKVKLGTEECRLWARVAPSATMKSVQNFKELGFLVQIVKPNQTRAVWLCKPIE